MKLMQTTVLNIQPEILALNDVTASEKMLLALYAANPEAKNYLALKAVGVGLSGLKKIKKRLIARGLLRVTANGFKVVVPGLLPAAEVAGGHFVSKSEDPPKSEKVAPGSAQDSAKSLALSHPNEPGAMVKAEKVKTPMEILCDFNRFFEFIADTEYCCTPFTLMMLCEDTIRDFGKEMPDCPEREAVLVELTLRRDAWFAIDFYSTHLPERDHRKYGRLIRSATPKQLARFRTSIQQGQLAGVKPTILLEQFAGK